MSNLPIAPYYEPGVLYTGASAYWLVSYPNFDPTFFSLSYYFNSADAGNFNISGSVVTQGQGGWQILVPVAVTSLWNPGKYSWQAVMLDGSGNTFVARTGRTEVKRGLSLSTDPYDNLTFAMKALDLVQCQLQNRLPDGIDRYMIGGRDITKIPLKELIELEKYYSQKVANELAQEATKKGRATKRNLFTQFETPIGSGPGFVGGNIYGNGGGM